MSAWQELAKAKRESILAAIPEKWRISSIPSAQEQRNVTGKYIQQFLTEKEIEITETDAVGILAKTTTGAWKAVEVTEAFCHRAALAHQLVNCLHEIFFDAALADARTLDAYFAEFQKPIGPLHGLPISLKDQFHVRGVETTMGYVGWINTFEGRPNDPRARAYESEMVRELRACGAVLYVKTAVPHTLMVGETINNIIGYVSNPTNRLLSSGGSSGGEGALIALRGSPVGFGTDIGGSIRIPAAFNGLFALRPSTGRLPYEGMANSMDGQNSILSVVGPLGTSVGALRLVVKSVLAQQPWLYDPLVHEIPWRSEQEQEVLDLVKSTGHGSGKQLVFGIMKDDGIVRPVPPVRRALDVVVKTIEKLGHKAIEWNPPSHKRGIDIAMQTWIFDGGLDIHTSLSLSGEPIVPQLLSGYGNAPVPQYTASAIAAVNVAKRQYQKEYGDYWNSTEALSGTGRPVDAVVMPVAPLPAARPGKYDHYGMSPTIPEAEVRQGWGGDEGYTTIINLLDYTSAVLPVTNVVSSIDVADPAFVPLSAAPEDRSVWASYDPAVYEGAWVGLQVVGRRLQEEKVLTVTEILAEGLLAA